MLLAVVCICCSQSAPGADAARHRFDIPAGDAIASFRIFAAQSGRQILYSGDAVAGVRTFAIDGRFTAREALVLMVADSGLAVFEDEKTGALGVTRLSSSTGNRGQSADNDPPSPKSSDTMKKKNVFSTLVAILGLAAPVGADAQRPGTGGTSAETSEEIVKLNVFQVESSAELGYRAASTVTATGIGAKIANIPINVGVVTDQFIEDWGGVELQDVTRGISSFNSDPLNSNRAWLRGFESSRILQDGFEIGFGMMTDGIDRVEVIKGPSAIFHGEVNPAGVVNLISSRPTWFPKHQVRVTVGGYDYYRGYVQSSGPLVADKLAYTAFVSYTDAKAWDDHSAKRFKVGGAALTWIPIPKLTLTLDARFTDREETQPALLPFSHPAFVEAVQAGQVAPRTSARTWLDRNPLYGPNEPQSQILVDDLLFKDRSSNPANGNYPQPEDRRSILFEAVYEHSEAVNLRVAAVDNEANRTSGFYTSFRPAAGFDRDLIFAIAEHRFNYGLSEQERRGLKFDLNLNGTFLGLKHAALVGYEYHRRYAGSSSIRTTATVWKPLIDPERDALAELRAENPNWFPPITTFGRLQSDSYYFADQVAMFDDKLRVLVGARHMKIDVTTTGANARTDSQSKTTPQFGVLFRPSELGAFYLNYSESFESQLVVDALGGVSGPITGEGIEAGIKTDWMDGKLSGTLGVYRIERANIARRDTPRERELDITPLWVLGGLQRTEGLDLDLTYTPIPNLQFMLAYSHMWFAETVADPQTPQQVGVRLRHAPDHAVGLFGKYHFMDGSLKGFFFGASAEYRTPFKFHDSWDVPYEIDDFRRLDLLFGYKRQLADRREWSLTLNVDNVTDEEYLDLTFFWADPITWRLTFDYRF